MGIFAIIFSGQKEETGKKSSMLNSINPEITGWYSTGLNHSFPPLYNLHHKQGCWHHLHIRLLNTSHYKIQSLVTSNFTKRNWAEFSMLCVCLGFIYLFSLVSGKIVQLFLRIMPGKIPYHC